MSLYHLIYVSTAINEQTDTDLQEILATSVRHNLEEGITGLLLYASGGFMQLLEGEEANVKSTYARIRQDPRHKNLNIFLEEPIEQRAFPAWSMAYRRIGSDDVGRYAKFAHYYQNGFSEAALHASPGIALDILRIFAQDNRLIKP